MKKLICKRNVRRYLCAAHKYGEQNRMLLRDKSLELAAAWMVLWTSAKDGN